MELLLIVLVFIFIVMLFKTVKERQDERKKSMFNIKMYNDSVEKPADSKPMQMRVVDMLIYPTNIQKGEFEIYPVLKDVLTNQIYVSFANHGYGKYYYHYYKNTKRIEIKKANGTALERNDEATLYLRKELGRIVIEKDKVIIGAKEYKYIGQMNNKKTKLRKNKLYNLTIENFLQRINGSVYYDGYIEF